MDLQVTFGDGRPSPPHLVTVVGECYEATVYIEFVYGSLLSQGNVITIIISFVVVWVSI